MQTHSIVPVPVPTAYALPTPPAVVVIAPPASFLVRAVWFCFVGWWLGGLAITLGYLASATLIGLPLGLWCFNRVGAAFTLRPRLQTWGAIRPVQRSWWLRLLWLPFGLILGAAWIALGYAFCATLIGLPLGILMLNRTPAVVTLERA